MVSKISNIIPSRFIFPHRLVARHPSCPDRRTSRVVVAPVQGRVSKPEPIKNARARAELFEEGGGQKFGPGWDKAWIRIIPERIVAWGIDGDPFRGANARSIR
jgi:hypothetical protein